MKQVVERLWELQKAMSQLAEKEKSLNEMPAPFKELHDEYETATREIDSLQTRLDGMAEERRKVETNLQDEQEKLKKYQGQLMLVKNQQQYAAAWKEIDASRKAVKELEDALMARMTEAEELQKSLEERTAGYEPLKSRYDTEYAAWQHSLADLRSEIAAVRERVTGIEAGIPPKTLGEFHRIYKHRQGIAVAPVVEGSCSACRVRVRPQAEQQLRRGELIFCEGCRRISYLESAES